MNRVGRVVCFGELLLRLSAPDGEHLFQTPRLDARFAGAEANVAVALANLGIAARMVSIVPDDAVGDGAEQALRRYGVDTSGLLRGQGRLGVFYLTPGAGLRASSILYDRADSLFARAGAGTFDWARLLDGADWLHFSGIVPAVGPRGVALGLEAMAAARAAGVSIAFDANFRPGLWARWCSNPAPILIDYAARADLMFGNHRDVSLLLGRTFDGDTPDRRRAAALAALDRFPRLAAIACTARTVIDARQNRLSARIDARDGCVETAPLEVTGIVDRIGAGDAFAAGVLAGLDRGLETAAREGLALAALKHATPGDFSLTTRRDLARFSASDLDVRR